MNNENYENESVEHQDTNENDYEDSNENDENEDQEISNDNLGTPKRKRTSVIRYSPSKQDLIEKSNRLKRKLELERLKLNKKTKY